MLIVSFSKPWDIVSGCLSTGAAQSDRRARLKINTDSKISRAPFINNGMTNKKRIILYSFD